MAVTTNSFTEGQLSQWLGHPPPRRPYGGYDLQTANLAGLRLTRAQLERADLRGACLANAYLPRARLVRADLTGADLSRAMLQRADLSGADLSGAVLRQAVLDGAVLAGARLAGTDLCGASLRDVALWQTRLKPSDVAQAVVSLDGALLELDPAGPNVEVALAWCIALGGDPERLVMQRLLEDRRWAGRVALLAESLRRLEQRIGPLTAASLSRAQPAPVGERSLSPAESPEQAPGDRSLSRRKE